MENQNFDELNKLFKQNLFREIEKNKHADKFYLLRSISKKKTIYNFAQKNKIQANLNEIFLNENITVEHIKEYIKENFIFKSEQEIKTIEQELNKMQYFDWGGSMGNSLEKNIINNFVKKTNSFKKINEDIEGSIFNSLKGYTLNSWYNHWSTILIEEIFNKHKDVIPTLDLVEKIDFFVKNVPFDLKVIFFPEELMKEKIANKLKEEFGYKNELSCFKKIANEIKISIPTDLTDKALYVCLYNLLLESTEQKAISFIKRINKIKLEIYEYYIKNPNELIVWLYENQGEMRFDASNRFFVVVIDKNKTFDSWKLKRNKNILFKAINEKINNFNEKKPNEISFLWHKDGKKYKCFSEIVFVFK